MTSWEALKWAVAGIGMIGTCLSAADLFLCPYAEMARAHRIMRRLSGWLLLWLLGLLM